MSSESSLTTLQNLHAFPSPIHTNNNVAAESSFDDAEPPTLIIKPHLHKKKSNGSSGGGSNTNHHPLANNGSTAGTSQHISSLDSLSSPNGLPTASPTTIMVNMIMAGTATTTSQLGGAEDAGGVTAAVTAHQQQQQQDNDRLWSPAWLLGSSTTPNGDHLPSMLLSSTATPTTTPSNVAVLHHTGNDAQ